jgi:hypothetical protein
MRCQNCNEKTAPHDLWCFNCGKRTDVLGNELSSVKSLVSTWKNYRQFRGINLPVGIIAALSGVLPLFLLLWLMNYTLPGLPLWQLLLMHAFVWTLFIPVLLVPFKAVCGNDDMKIDLKSFFSAFSSYGQYILFSFISVVFYVFIFFTCQGDPILNLVWLVLVLYWVAIVLPVPVLMQRYRLGAFKALIMAYKHTGDVRWNLFLMAIILTLINLLATVLFVVGLAVTVPFTWYAIRDFSDKLIEFEVFDSKAE